MSARMWNMIGQYRDGNGIVKIGWYQADGNWFDENGVWISE